MQEEDWVHIEKLAFGLIGLLAFWIMSATLRSWTQQTDHRWIPIVAIVLYGVILLYGLYTMSGLVTSGEY